ncbi:MAG: SRPBCC family protein [Candidatus Limnocylindria bacterium]
MTLDVTATVRIEATPERVAAVEFDPERDPDWIGGVDRVERITPPPLGLGSEVRRLGGFLGRPIEWVMQVQAFEPASHLGMHALKSPFPMDVDYQLQPLDGGRATQASIRIRGEGRGMYGLPGPLMGPMVRRSVLGDLKRLKRIVEGARC